MSSWAKESRSRRSTPTAACSSSRASVAATNSPAARICSISAAVRSSIMLPVPPDTAAWSQGCGPADRAEQVPAEGRLAERLGGVPAAGVERPSALVLLAPGDRVVGPHAASPIGLLVDGQQDGDVGPGE